MVHKDKTSNFKHLGAIIDLNLTKYVTNHTEFELEIHTHLATKAVKPCLNAMVVQPNSVFLVGLIPLHYHINLSVGLDLHISLPTLATC